MITELPQDLTKINVRQYEEWVKYLAKKSLKELRKRQKIIEDQLIANHGNPNLQIVQAVTAGAVDFKTFHDDGWKAHTPRHLINV